MAELAVTRQPYGRRFNRVPHLIRAAFSEREDKSCTSFLDLPGEVRNTVYELVVHFPGLLTISRSKLVWIPSKTHTVVGMPLPRHPGHDLLLVCRQVYHEAATLFFQSNSFLFNCDNWEVGVHTMDDYGTMWVSDVGKIGLRWTQQLGSTITMLQRVNINIMMLCVSSRNRVGPVAIPNLHLFSFDYLPLLEYLWGSENHPEITLVHFDAAGSICQGPHHPNAQPGCTVRVDTLNNVLRVLCGDELDIKKELVLLRYVGVSQDGSWGGVFYNGSRTAASSSGRRYDVSPESTRYFRLLEDDKIARMLMRQPTLPSLPYPILRQIVNYATTYSYPTSLNAGLADIDNAFRPSGYSLSSVNHELRFTAIDSWTENPLNLEMHSHGNKAGNPIVTMVRRNNSNFEHRWRPFVQNFEASRIALPPSKLIGQINLHVKSSREIPMTSVRIKVRDLLRISSASSGWTMIHISSGPSGKQTSSTGYNSQGKVKEIYLEGLRHAVFKALSYIVENKPSTLHARCPEIWINGYGKPVEFCLHGSSQMQAIPLVANEPNSQHWGPAYASQYLGLAKRYGPAKPYDGSTRPYLRYLIMVGAGVDLQRSAKSNF